MSTQEDNLRAIADAIREKDGTTDPIKASTFPERIRAIPSGGGLPDDVRTITLTADPPEGGTVSGGGVASDGMVITVSATPENRYGFNGWQRGDNIVSVDTAHTFTVDQDVLLIASFGLEEVSRLPSGYIEVEYIESISGQYIDTGIGPTVTTRIEIDLDLVDGAPGGTSGRFFGAAYKPSYTSSTTYWFDAFLRNGYLCLRYGSLGYQDISPMSLGRHSISVDLKGRTVTLDGVSASLTRAMEVRSNASIALSILNKKEGSTVSAIYPAYEKIYSCQIYDDDVIVGNYVPCISPDGDPGMYDLVTSAFFPNKGSGSFVAGPPV